MKITKFLVLALFVLLLSSCHDNPMLDTPDEPEQNTPEESDSDNTTDEEGWQRYIGKHFTSETSDQFYWIQHFLESYSSYEYFLRACPYHDIYQSLRVDEFVEFFDLTDRQIKMRVGNEKISYFDLADLTNNQITIKVMCPYSASGINQVIEIPLIFEFDPQTSNCFFRGKYTDQYGFIYISSGIIRSNLHIAFNYGYHTSPFCILREEKYAEATGIYSPEYLVKDLSPITYTFDNTTLRCIQSPITVRWNSSVWKGDVASLIPDLSNFLQLLIGIPVLNSKDYYKRGVTDSEISIERVIRTAFTGVTQKYVLSETHGVPNGRYEEQGEEYGPLTSALSISKIDDNRMCIVVDSKDISLRNSNLKDRLFYANILQSLLSEDRCHFVMQYELIDCDLNDKSKEREFHMTLTDPQHSRNIMEYVILPLLIENRQAIKDYIRQDAELSQHAEILCSAVDRLEEIFAATTDLTLGYRLIENQWD